MTSQGVYISQATREVEYKLGKYNSIIAPVGSGKTTYAEGKLLDELDNMSGVREGYTILLAPYKSLVNQVEDGGVYERARQRHEITLNGDILFGTGNNSVSKDDLLVMTPHKFFNMMNELHHTQRDVGMSNVRAIIVDESDHVFCRLPTWERDTNGDMVEEDKNTFSLASEFVREYCDDVLFIGITATNEYKLKDTFYGCYNNITFKEELKQQQFSVEDDYSDLRLAYNRAMEGLIRGRDKVAIYVERITSMKKYREYFEGLGLKVAMITADNPKNYTPTVNEKVIKDELSMSSGVSETFHMEGYDILLYNAAMERGVSIKDESFRVVIVHSSEEDVQIQAAGRFRFDGLRKYVLADEEDRLRGYQLRTTIDKKTGKVTDEIVIPRQWLDIPLTTQDKKDLIDDIGYNKTWRALKPDLIELGYEIKDTRKRIDKKSTRVSIISK